MDEVIIPVKKLRGFVKKILLKVQVRDDVAEYVTEGLVQTSLRGVDSHGIRLLEHYIKALRGGRINPNPQYRFKKTSPSTGLLDADHTFGHAAGMKAVEYAIGLAKKAGSGHIAVYNSTHFGAAAYYSLEIARHNMIGMVFTNTDALLKTYAGKRAFLGNNPISFAAPCADEEPFCLDMATSVVTFNKIRQWREDGVRAPLGVGANLKGIETTDPTEITMLLPIGGYKGYGLSLVVEILCSLLTGMPYGPHIPRMFEAPLGQKRFLGHFISAIRIGCFCDEDIFKNKLSVLMKEIRNEPPLNKEIPVQVAGDPEKKIAGNRKLKGIPLNQKEYNSLKNFSDEYGVDFL